MDPSETIQARPKPRLARLVALAVLAGVLVLLVMAAANTPGNSKSGDGFIEQVVSSANGSASVTLPLALKEGDPEHESAHVFQAVSAVKGVNTARLVVADKTLVLTYDPAVVTEAGLRDALRAAGYLAEAPAAQ